MILNLSNDIVKGKTTPMKARNTFGKIAKEMMQGKMHPYLETLQFKPETLNVTRTTDRAFSMSFEVV